MTTKPSIVLVHGFWGGAAHWAKVIVELRKLGHEFVRAVENPLTSLADDAERTRKMIAQQKGPVVLVGHSYGGAVITEAGDAPNVAGLVYIAAFAPEVGESLAQIASGGPGPAGAVNVSADSDGYVWINPAKFRESFCQDVTEDEAFVMAATQKAPVGTTFGNSVTRASWKRKPSWYQLSTQDRMIHPDNQRRMSQRLDARKIISLEASHASLVSYPREVSALIDEAATALG
jgi:pimeloyl-ACP methyl ester carboxylesterase